MAGLRKPRQNLQTTPLTEGQIVHIGEVISYRYHDNVKANSYISEDARKAKLSPKIVTTCVFVPLEGRYAGKPFRIDRFASYSGNFYVNRSSKAIDDENNFKPFRFAFVNISKASFTQDRFQELLQIAAGDVVEAGMNEITQEATQAEGAVTNQNYTQTEPPFPTLTPAPPVDMDKLELSSPETLPAAVPVETLYPDIELKMGQIWVIIKTRYDLKARENKASLGEVKKIIDVTDQKLTQSICFTGLGMEEVPIPDWKKDKSSPSSPRWERRAKQPTWVGSDIFKAWINKNSAQLAPPELIAKLERHFV